MWEAETQKQPLPHHGLTGHELNAGMHVDPRFKRAVGESDCAIANSSLSQGDLAGTHLVGAFCERMGIANGSVDPSAAKGALACE
jgi:hypothetical protein